ncbi:hypothetical protein GCM10010385_51640 [Streptomyces geysiriensis]|nr:hypothetical protein GCM10010385_51640 [Streptomyces geysiriensis]GGZ45849.1 hypothetical protein GCM10010301_17690 [Streptomyces plicatus]GHC03912.1 hypothetical protein GCM10010308_15820 [Streptomyces vinaceusdrappus]
MAGPCTIRLTQQGVPGACRAGFSPFRPAGPRASVIVTLFSALRGPCVRLRSDWFRSDGPGRRCRTAPGAGLRSVLVGQPWLSGWYSMCSNPHAS